MQNHTTPNETLTGEITKYHIRKPKIPFKIIQNTSQNLYHNPKVSKIPWRKLPPAAPDPLLPP